MAGEYVSIHKGFDWRSEDEDKEVWMGKTHGCGCCSDDVALTPGLVRMHIRALYEDIAKANEVLRDMGEDPEGPPA